MGVDKYRMGRGVVGHGGGRLRHPDVQLLDLP